MNALFIHICAGLAVYPVSLPYWCLYWHIQPSDPNSLEYGFDVVTGQPIPKKAYKIKYIGFTGACIIGVVWALIGKYYAESPMLGIDLLAFFNWSEYTLDNYLFWWFCIVAGMIFLAWNTAKVLVGRKKWNDDKRRLY